MKTNLIDPQNLNALISEPKVRVLDATYGTPNWPESAILGMQHGRIGQAQFFNIDEVADQGATYAHTLPTAEAFADAVGKLGIANDDLVVVYDQNGLSFAAARVWWMFRVFGHDNVKVLNGGLPAWRQAGLPLTQGPIETPATPPTPFFAAFKPALYRDFDAIEAGGDTVLDARGAARFASTARTMDGDMVPANIPGSLNLPFAALLDPMGKLMPAETLKLQLEPFMGSNTLVASCGSGVTACVLALGFAEAGRDDVAIYGGSWTEWADRQGLR